MRLLALAGSRSLTSNRPLLGRLVTPTITGRLPASLGDRTFAPWIEALWGRGSGVTRRIG